MDAFAIALAAGAAGVKHVSSAAPLPVQLRAIARSAPALQLAGATDADAGEVDELLAASPEQIIAALPAALETRTFLAGHGLTIADIYAFAALKTSGRAADVEASSAAVSRWAATCSASLPVADAEKASGVSAAAAPAKAAPAAKAAAGGAGAAAAAPAADGAAAPAAKKDKGEKNKGDPARAAAALAAKRAAAGGAGGEAGAGAGSTSSGNIGGGGSMGSLPKLAGGKEGEVVTRFPPEPSGYLHIGHVKALLLNDAYAKAYKGKMLIRFDDTNPSKEKDEYEQAILADITSLGVSYVSISHTSDHFPLIENEARRMIREGKAYMDDTPKEEMQRQRMAREESKYRAATTEDNLARFETMLKGGPEGAPWCLRARMNMADDNGTCRDPVLYRVNETPHHRTGTKYKAYPTYDFACPIVDALEGVTHALRSSEYHDRDEQFYRLQDMLGVRRVVIQDFARLNFVYTLLSKRKLTWFVDNGVVEGWNDPRFPTVQGILRRGVVLPALREFILSQGASKRIIEMEWDKFWALNRKHIDPIAPRYTALPRDTMVPFHLADGPAEAEIRTHALHPKNADVGVKAVHYTKRVFLDVADATAMKEGEEITLMKWGNAIVRKITRDAAGKITAMEGNLNLAGDVKSTEKKVNWLPDSPDNVPFVLSEFDYLIKVPNLDEGDDFKAAINPVTRLDTPMIGEPGMRTVQANDIIQLERRGFVRCDKPFVAADRPGTLFAVPDGKVKGLYGLADRAAAVAAGGAGKA